MPHRPVDVGDPLVRQMGLALWRWTFFGLLLAWAAYAGKDVSWDVLNHQLYLPFSWVTGRFRTDLFAAGGQSYQNPIGYFPIYWLIRLGVDSWGICFVIAALHAAVIWPLDRTARLFWPAESGDGVWLRLLSLAACCAAPVFLIHVGTTSSDPITALMVLWTIALTLENGYAAEAKPRGRAAAVLAGALLGLACAVKLSNLVFALALCLVWCGKRAIGQVRWLTLFAFAGGLAGSFAVFAGPWMLWLWHDFGNPVFPLFNNIFHSPYAPQQALTTLRFVPTTPWGQVSRLWELARYQSFVSFEGFIPDLRPILLVAAGLVAALALARHDGWRRLAAPKTWGSPGVQLAVFLALSYVLWVRSSGNARYALPMFLVAGVALVRAAQVAAGVRVAKILLLVALLLQLVNYQVLGTHRFTATYWDTAPYVDYRMSPRMREQPFLHLGMGIQSNSNAALFLARDGAMANVFGDMPLPIDGPLGDRLRSLLAKWHGRTRILFSATPDFDPTKADKVQAGLRALMYRVHLDVNWNDCERIYLHVNRDEPIPERDGLLLSCAVVDRHVTDPVADAQLVRADQVFALLEKACPRDFSPSPLASEHNTGSWRREYANSDAAVTASEADGVLFTHFRQFATYRFGSIDDVLAQKAPVQCPLISFQTPK